MMYKKKIFNLVLILIIGTALILSSCQLAKEEIVMDTDPEAVDEFRGFYITNSPLNVNYDESDISSEKIWGEIIESHTDKVEIKFPDTDGMNFFYALIGDESDNSLYRATFADEKIFDGEFKFLDQVSMKGNIYVLASVEKVFYCNPVYQTSEGLIYVTSAETGVQSSSEASTETYMEYSYSKPAEGSEGESGIDEISLNIRADISFIPMDNVEKYVFLYMDAEDNILETLEIYQNNQDENLMINSNVEYIIVQIHHVDPTGEVYVSREILEKNQTDYTTKFFTEENLGTSGLILLSWE